MANEKLEHTKKLIELAKSVGLDTVHLDLEISKNSSVEAYNAEILPILQLIKASGLKSSWDSPFWIHKDTAKIVSKYCDSVTFMSYRNNANGVIQLVKLGRKNIKIPFLAGVETDKIDEKTGEDSISFYGQTNEYLNQELKKIENYFKWNKKFEGVAIHFYDSYREMK